MYIHLYITSIAVSTLKAFLHFCICYVPLTSLVRIWSEPELNLWVHYACDYVRESFIYVHMYTYIHLCSYSHLTIGHVYNQKGHEIAAIASVN